MSARRLGNLLTRPLPAPPALDVGPGIGKNFTHIGPARYNTETMGLQKLNLGCGENKKAGYVNVDWQEAVHPDVLHDLNQFPYPFSDGTSDLIEAFHVVEHLDRPFAVVKELHRILKPGGVLQIK